MVSLSHNEVNNSCLLISHNHCIFIRSNDADICIDGQRKSCKQCKDQDMGSTNEIRRYIITSSFTGWVRTRMAQAIVGLQHHDRYAKCLPTAKPTSTNHDRWWPGLSAFILTHLGLGTHIYSRQPTGSYLVHVMLSHLWGTEPYPKPVPTCCPLKFSEIGIKIWILFLYLC